jgi:hypothetical protein
VEAGTRADLRGGFQWCPYGARPKRCARSTNTDITYLASPIRHQESMFEAETPWAIRGELLPGWYDDWVMFERERLRQLQLHALETMAHRLAKEHRYADAVDVALAAVRLEPLRERHPHTDRSSPGGEQSGGGAEPVHRSWHGPSPGPASDAPHGRGSRLRHSQQIWTAGTYLADYAGPVDASAR